MPMPGTRHPLRPAPHPVPAAGGSPADTASTWDNEPVPAPRLTRILPAGLIRFLTAGDRELPPGDRVPPSCPPGETVEMPDGGPVPDGRFGVAGLLAWMLILVFPAWSVVDQPGGPDWVTLALLVCSGALYIVLAYTATHRQLRPVIRYPTLAVYLVISLYLAALFGPNNGTMLMVFPAMAMALVLPIRAAFGGVLTIALAGCVIGYLGHGSAGAVFGLAFSSFVSGLVVFAMRRLFLVIRLLREARQDLARAAVTEERLRFSRDLHDLLGHSLSVIVVKAEVVRRLVGRDPDAAASAAGDIELVGRQALTEVREAVTGYRQRPLHDELDGARSALTDAGIDPVVRLTAGPLGEPADTLIGWAVREGVTNTIRHSRAHRCEIDVRRDDDGVVLTVRDDGVGPGTLAGADLADRPGHHGLRGLTERLAAVGGTITAGPGPGGRGFQLTATVPATAE